MHQGICDTLRLLSDSHLTVYTECGGWEIVSMCWSECCPSEPLCSFTCALGGLSLMETLPASHHLWHKNYVTFIKSHPFMKPETKAHRYLLSFPAACWLDKNVLVLQCWCFAQMSSGYFSSFMSPFSVLEILIASIKDPPLGTPGAHSTQSCKKIEWPGNCCPPSWSFAGDWRLGLCSPNSLSSVWDNS